ncbi:MAG: peptide deformylase [Vulcanimicrobiota bacterium]
MVKEIILLGNPVLYQMSLVIGKEETGIIKEVVNDLHDTLMNFRKKYRAGRAVAAPQIGVLKRLIYMHIDKPVVIVNPTLHFEDDELMEVLDDCMSFPELLVKVKRHKRCTIQFKDIDFNDRIMKLEGDLSELLQHEYDHLDGILATMRAIDDKSLCLKSQKNFFNGV